MAGFPKFVKKCFFPKLFFLNQPEPGAQKTTEKTPCRGGNKKTYFKHFHLKMFGALRQDRTSDRQTYNKVQTSKDLIIKMRSGN